MLNYEFPPLGGGSSPVTLHLGRELVRRGHAVDLVTMAYRGLPREETVAGIRVRRIPALRRHRHRCSTPEMVSFCLAAIPRLPRFVRAEGYDVNHTHFIFPTGLVALACRLRTGLPYMLTSHGSDVPGYNPDRFGWQHRLLGPLWRRIVKGAELVTTPSEDHGDLVRRRAPRARVLAVPNGIDPDEWDLGRKRKKIVLGAGRLFPRKNYHLVIQAMAGLDPAWELVLVGEGTERGRLEALAREKGVTLRITGWLDRQGREFRELFAQARIFVLPSLQESFGMVAAEAMAAGLAVVVSDRGGLAEVAGDAGLLVPPDEVEPLRRALGELMESPDRLDALAEKGRERACRLFAWPVVARRFEELYRSLPRPR